MGSFSKLQDKNEFVYVENYSVSTAAKCYEDKRTTLALLNFSKLSKVSKLIL